MVKNDAKEYLRSLFVENFTHVEVKHMAFLSSNISTIPPGPQILYCNRKKSCPVCKILIEIFNKMYPEHPFFYECIDTIILPLFLPESYNKEFSKAVAKTNDFFTIPPGPQFVSRT